MSEKIIFLKEQEEYITLNVLLKIADTIQTGGMAKWYLSENTVYVNDESENRRGRKLYDGDVIRTSKATYLIKKHDN